MKKKEKKKKKKKKNKNNNNNNNNNVNSVTHSVILLDFLLFTVAMFNFFLSVHFSFCLRATLRTSRNHSRFHTKPFCSCRNHFRRRFRRSAGDNKILQVCFRLGLRKSEVRLVSVPDACHGWWAAQVFSWDALLVAVAGAVLENKSRPFQISYITWDSLQC